MAYSNCNIIINFRVKLVVLEQMGLLATRVHLYVNINVNNLLIKSGRERREGITRSPGSERRAGTQR